MVYLYKFNKNPEVIKKVVDRMLGVPYKHNGRSFDGVDCWGVVYLFFKELGMELPVSDGQFISDEWYRDDPERYIRSLKTLGEEVGHYRNLQSLDIPYFNLYKNVITHTSVMLDDTHFLHVLIEKKVAIGTMNRRLWRAKYRGARRIIN